MRFSQIPSAAYAAAAAIWDCSPKRESGVFFASLLDQEGCRPSSAMTGPGLSSAPTYLDLLDLDRRRRRPVGPDGRFGRRCPARSSEYGFVDLR